MNDEEKLIKAKDLIEKLSMGIDPITNEDMTSIDFFSDSSISESLEYIISVLENNIQIMKSGLTGEKFRSRDQFYITDKQRSELKPVYGECKVSDIAKEINRVTEGNDTKTMQAVWINNWLEKAGMLYRNTDGNRVATAEGEKIGITSELHRSTKGTDSYTNLFSPQAQNFVYENISEIIRYNT